MKEITKYLCDLCNKDFDSEYDCTQHELQHSKVVEVVTAEYTSNHAYPFIIEVAFRDGTQLIYNLEEDTNKLIK